jgi:hypothetical protein
MLWNQETGAAIESQYKLCPKTVAKPGTAVSAL